MRFWGITGTNGKTTTAWVLADFVNAAPGRKCGYITTVEVFDGKDRFYTGYTTPPLARLKEIYAAMESNGCTDCAMEVSSHAIHQNRVGFGETTTFSGGAFTNLSEDHLDYHKTMEEYFRVKLDFARRIAQARPAPAPDLGRRDFPPYVVCLDGGFGREMFNAASALPLNTIPVSVEANSRAAAVGGGYDLSGLRLIGAYNRSNVLVAAALAEAAGVPREAIQAAIPLLKPRWGRLEPVEYPHVAAKVYVDFAHTPDGLEKMLAAVRGEMRGGEEGELWIVFGAGGDRDPMKRRPMGAACARLADRLVVTSDNPRSEDPLAIIGAIMEGVRGEASGRAAEEAGRVLVEPDRAKAIALALSRARAGDTVVIAGKGHETTQEIAGVRHPFDDREAVRLFKGTPFLV